jgi:hypothetical protein
MQRSRRSCSQLKAGGAGERLQWPPRSAERAQSIHYKRPVKGFNMGTRGRRSVAELSAIRPIRRLKPVDFQALVQQCQGRRREAERALKRAERRGQAVCRPAENGVLEWFWAC